MTHRLVSRLVRVIAVALVLVLGCSSGHYAGSAATVALHAPRSAAAVARASSPPSVKVLALFAAERGQAEEQEIHGSLVVRAARPEAVKPAIAYNHAPDYRWLTGELRYSPARGAWCLHYAAAGENDRHGGTVTLVAPNGPAGLHPGQLVRVAGELIEPQSEDPSPCYRVREIHPIPSE